MAPKVTRQPIVRQVEVSFSTHDLADILAEKARELTGEKSGGSVEIIRLGNGLHSAKVSFKVVIAHATEDNSGRSNQYRHLSTDLD